MAHYIAIATALALGASIFGLIIWAHVADQRAFDRSSLDLVHKTCKPVDLNEALLREHQLNEVVGDLAFSWENFLTRARNMQLQAD